MKVEAVHNITGNKHELFFPADYTHRMAIAYLVRNNLSPVKFGKA